MSLYTYKQMNKVILNMYSSYIQIQIAYFKTGIRVLYIIFLQTLDTEEDLIQGQTLMYYSQSAINQFFLWIIKKFFISILILLCQRVTGEKWKTRFDSTYFFNHRHYQDALATVRPWINV